MSNPKPQLAAVFIAKDAASSIGRGLKSVRRLADEVIVVVDTTTSDETAEIAKAEGARVFRRKFTDFSDQKNYAVSKAKGEWVLALDADEEISAQLAKEIKSVLTQTDVVGFLVSRQNYIFGKLIRHANWEPSADTHIWLWRKRAGRWIGAVHEEVMVQGQVKRLKGYKIHRNYKSVEQFIAKMNDYTSRETTPANPIGEFGRRYIWHLGFLDGWHGLFLSYLQAIYHLIVWVKLWEKKTLRSVS